MGQASACVDEGTIGFASVEAKREFHRLRSRITFRSVKWTAHDEEQQRAQAILDKYAIRKKLKEDKPEAEGRMSASAASQHLKRMNQKLHQEYDGDDLFTWQYAVYVKSVFIVHVGGTRYVTSRTDNIMKIHARITLKVEFIRGYIFIFLLYV